MLVISPAVIEEVPLAGLAFSTGGDKLPRGENGQPPDGRRGKVPRVARHRVTPERDGTFCGRFRPDFVVFCPPVNRFFVGAVTASYA
jgi:hypothetical protein